MWKAVVRGITGSRCLTHPRWSYPNPNQLACVVVVRRIIVADAFRDDSDCSLLRHPPGLRDVLSLWRAVAFLVDLRQSLLQGSQEAHLDVEVRAPIFAEPEVAPYIGAMKVSRIDPARLAFMVKAPPQTCQALRGPHLRTSAAGPPTHLLPSLATSWSTPPPSAASAEATPKELLCFGCMPHTDGPTPAAVLLEPHRLASWPAKPGSAPLPVCSLGQSRESTGEYSPSHAPIPGSRPPTGDEQMSTKLQQDRCIVCNHSNLLLPVMKQHIQADRRKDRPLKVVRNGRLQNLMQRQLHPLATTTTAAFAPQPPDLTTLAGCRA